MKKILKNKKLLITLIVVAIVILILVISTTNIIIKRNTKKQKEEPYSFTYEVTSFVLDDDYLYTFNALVVISDLETGIETVKYEQDGKELVINCNGKQRVGIDFSAKENVDYEFKITPKGKPEKTEILNIKRKTSGAGTYKEINGIYVNTPFLEDFNNIYTRYMYTNENDKLTPGNWIYDEEPDGWYDYKNGKWANVYVEAEGIENYYVWIPRYVYKIDAENSVAGNERMDVKFVDVYNTYKNAETGETISYKELLAQGYILPEAFEWGDGENDANLTQISGYWISKYQLSELTSYKMTFNMAVNKNSIVLSNFTNNVSTATKYTYALNGKIVETKESLEDYIFENLEKNQRYIVNVTALSETGEILGSMTKILEPTEVNPPDLSGFDQDTTFYVYWDENGNEQNSIPIRNKENEPKEWYDYTFTQWANVVTRNDGLETYWVWIPRYQYSLNGTTQRSDIKFIIGTGTEVEPGYTIPEAFWWDKNDDGKEQEDEQITGYWIAKYQMSAEETNPRMNVEMTAGSNAIHMQDITGTNITGKEGLIFEYYLNGEKQYVGEDAKEYYTFTGLEKGKTYVINIIAREKESDKYIGAVTKKVKTISMNEPEVNKLSEAQIESSGGNQTYYVIYEEDNTTIKEYIPVEEGANEPTNWYDYSISKWANILITDGTVNGNQITGATYTSYFVWVPRYQYKLNTTLQRTDVKFIEGTGPATEEGYTVPEAFWWDKNDNNIEDEDEQLTGYWISKYQLK